MSDLKTHILSFNELEIDRKPIENFMLKGHHDTMQFMQQEIDESILTASGIIQIEGGYVILDEISFF